MESLRTTYLLAAILGILLVSIIVSHVTEVRPDTSASQMAGAIFPNLKPDAITRIELKRKDDTATLVLEGPQWTVAEQFGYPADPGKVDALLSAIRRYNDAAIISDKPAVQADFGVTPEVGTLVKMYAGEKLVADFIAGKPGVTPTVGYIRKTDDNRVLEVYGNPMALFSTRSGQWLKTSLFGVKADDITSVKVSGTDVFQLVKEDSKWKYADGGSEVPNEQKIGQFTYFLSAASFREVAGKAGDKLAEWGLLPAEWTIEFDIAGGTTNKLQIGSKRDASSWYARINDSEFVIVLPNNIAEVLRTTKMALTSGAEPQKPKQPKVATRTKYTVEGKGEPLPQVKIVTNKGNLIVELWEDDSPNTVANFIYLAESGFYDGLTFHRHEPIVLQGGDPSGDGSGGPGWNIESEISDRKYDFGVMGMADAGVGTGGSQFFFAMGPNPQWDVRYTNFGHIIAGQDVLKTLTKGDVMIRMEIVNKRNHPYLPFVYREGSEKEERLAPAQRKPPVEKNAPPGEAK